MSSRSISSANTSGAHLKQSRGLSRPTMLKIFPRILKHRSSPHCRFSVASGKFRQYSRISSTFMVSPDRLDCAMPPAAFRSVPLIIFLPLAQGGIVNIHGVAPLLQVFDMPTAVRLHRDVLVFTVCS